MEGRRRRDKKQKKPLGRRWVEPPPSPPPEPSETEEFYDADVFVDEPSSEHDYDAADFAAREPQHLMPSTFSRFLGMASTIQEPTPQRSWTQVNQEQDEEYDRGCSSTNGGMHDRRVDRENGKQFGASSGLEGEKTTQSELQPPILGNQHAAAAYEQQQQLEDTVHHHNQRSDPKRSGEDTERRKREEEARKAGLVTEDVEFEKETNRNKGVGEDKAAISQPQPYGMVNQQRHLIQQYQDLLDDSAVIPKIKSGDTSGDKDEKEGIRTVAVATIEDVTKNEKLEDKAFVDNDEEDEGTSQTKTETVADDSREPESSSGHENQQHVAIANTSNQNRSLRQLMHPSMNGGQIAFGRENSAANRLNMMKQRWDSVSHLSSAEGSSSSVNSSVDYSDSEDEEKSESDASAANNITNTNNNDESRGENVEEQRQSTTSMDRRRLLLESNKLPSGNRVRALLAFKEVSKSVRNNITGRDNVNFKHRVRSSRQIDMETGVKSTREFTAQKVVDPEYFTPMDPRQRRKKLFYRKQAEALGAEVDENNGLAFNKQIGKRASMSGIQKSLGMQDQEESPPVQYRLSSMIAKDDNSFFKEHFHLLREYLYWCLRKSFLWVLFTESVIYLVICWSFSICYYILGRLNPECIVGAGGLTFEEGQMGFVDAFTLSWTTFSTVGYGHIHPQIHGSGTSTHCVFVTMLTSWQSFVGVLSASFCSAILFAKIAKTQSIAHVAFSENVVIRFGHELLQDSLRNSSKHNPLLRDSTRGDLAIDLFKKKQITKYPAPILEFRIVNLLHGETGGEVMNCKLNVVASSLEEVTKQDCITSRSSFMDTALPSKQAVKGMKILQSLKEKAKKAKKAAKVSTSGKISRSGSLIQKVNRKLTDFAALSGRGFRTSDSDDSEGEPFKEEDDDDESESGFEFGDGGFGNVDFGDLLCEEYSVELAEPSVAEEKAPDKSKKFGKKSDKKSDKKSGKKKKKHDPFVDRSKTIFVDEEPSEGDGGPRRVFSKVVMETDSHPFFKRVWNVRHILNEKSPLLNADARSLIRLNDGFWPASMCNADVIKSCLEVTQLIVTMSGTAVASGSSVYKLHVYDLNLAKVGYIFENPLAKDRDGKLTVDWNLVNAMVPQKEAKDEELSDCSINLDSGDRGQSRFGRMRRRLSFGMTTLGPTA